MKTKEPKKHSGQWYVRGTTGQVRWITKVNDTIYWFEGRSATIRNGWNTMHSKEMKPDTINYVDFDGGPTVKVGNSLFSYGVDGVDEHRVIKSVKMAAVPAAELLFPDWVRVEVITD